MAAIEAAGRLPLRHEPRIFGQDALHCGLNLFLRRPRDDRVYVGVRFLWISDYDFARQLREPFYETVGDSVDYVETLRGRADLAGVQKTGPHGPTSYDVEVHVLADDKKIDAARLEIDLLERVGSEPHDALSDNCRSRERNHVHTRIRHERFTRLFPNPSNDAKNTRRQNLEGPHQRKRCEQSFVGRFEHHRAARGERGGHLPRHQQQRVG
jgi:hypothetical protein